MNTDKHSAEESRRTFVQKLALSGVALTIPAMSTTAPAPFREADRNRNLQARGFLNVLRPPDSVTIQTATADVQLTATSSGTWSNNDIVLVAIPQQSSLHISLTAPATPVKRVHLRWRGNASDVRLIAGDAWERAYGDLEWRAWAPDRVMPWYFATHNGAVTNAYGVATGAKAFCFWQIDPQGISLWTDVRNGGSPLQLGARTLDVCTVVSRAGHASESAFAAVHAFCKQMCTSPRLLSQPAYGSNDWYWAYGDNSAATVRVDAERVVELSPTGSNRPFAVIDDGWQPERSKDKGGVGAWDHGNEKFGDMAALAADVHNRGARPGIWIRPLQASKDTPDSWRLSRDKQFLDPTVPEVREKISADISRLHGWGYDLIKHDYSSYDLMGRWGSQMGADMTRNGWTFASGPSRTTAEIIDDLYQTIRKAAGDSVIIGCNTVSHLSAGHFEMCRVGDDTSGNSWSRVRKMGVNSLAFRGAQHNAFYAADADCVGVTNNLPWSLNRQWLDLLSRSGTMTFVSLAPDAIGAEQRRDLKAALALAASPQKLAEPLDWQHNVYPSRWQMADGLHVYDWVGSGGAGLP